VRYVGLAQFPFEQLLFTFFRDSSAVLRNCVKDEVVELL
jgi:hypothetical protein